jgi:hypothetical protein
MFAQQQQQQQQLTERRTLPIFTFGGIRTRKNPRC